MITALARKFFGSHNDRTLRSQDALVAEINALEPEFKALTDAGLRAKTDAFKGRLARGETLDDLLVDLDYALCEAGKG